MLVLIGTVPEENFPFVSGIVSLKGERLSLDGHETPINRGTPALVAAACVTCEMLGLPLPLSFLVGDEGAGHGSRKLYAYLETQLPKIDAEVITFHYLQPDVDWHNRILLAMQEKGSLPVMIADAGYMYAAKMSGFAPCYDLFTPDIGEMAFLADEVAPHPFYTRGLILHQEDDVPMLIRRAYEGRNAAKTLLIKGTKDYICTKERIVAIVDSPEVRELEPVGGTGDTITGMAAALVFSGYRVPEAATIAARANRLAGILANPTPASQVLRVIEKIPEALETALKEVPREQDEAKAANKQV